MDLSVLVVLAALVALCMPVYLYFTTSKGDKNQPLSHSDLVRAANTVLSMHRNTHEIGKPIVIYHVRGRLLLYDLLQEDKTRIV